MRLVFVCVLLLGSALAQNPKTQHGGGTCDTNFDCSLGGVCTDHKCVCDVWFTGPTCSLLNMAPPASMQAGLTPQSTNGYHTWGGHAAKGEDGKYWGAFSLMEGHCTLSTWTTNSAIVLASSDNVTGPYTLAAEPVAPPTMIIGPWAHNAMLTRNPTVEVGHPEAYLMVHIGSGQVPRSQWKNCSSTATNEEEDVDTAFQFDGAVNSEYFYYATAPRVSGPWTNSPTPLFVNLTDHKYWSDGVTNPAPYIFPNGTALMYFAGATCPEGWGNLAPNCIGVARADSWKGPYIPFGSLPIAHPEAEDPFVFRDPRGSFHLLVNVNTFHKRCAQGVPCGGHAWSEDGLTWSTNFTVGSFGPIITLQSGKRVVNAYVERPQVVLDSEGRPDALFLGMGASSYAACQTWAQSFCKEGDKGCGAMN